MATRFDKWKLTLVPEDLVRQYNDRIAIDCTRCPVSEPECESKRDDEDLECKDVFLSWAKEEAK
ncbi:hypothetical protein FACS1894187_19360 [Synergistales bacterium]|nr:hypothetical protein FACS1894187_19360 [Synergistales bacterium]